MNMIAALAILASSLLQPPAPSPAAPPAVQPAVQQPECSRCHTCPQPSSDTPCLQLCPRHEFSAALSPRLGPTVIALGELENLYVPVRFDHRQHAVMAGMSGGCDTCHHFTPPSAPHPACKSCHAAEISREDLAKPGLKGAYHRRCLGCHREWDSSAACEVCHEKRSGGRLGGTATQVCDHAHYAPIELKEIISFPTSFAAGDVVRFDHKSHSQKYVQDCTECHHRQSCTRCHIHGGGELHPMATTEEAGLHAICFACHDSERCTACHGRDPATPFSHAATGWPLKPYHAALPCRSCHGATISARKLDAKCPACHARGLDPTRFDHAVTGAALDEAHREVECDGCHTGGLGSPAHCDGCHDDGRAYDRARGFAAVNRP